MCNRCKSMHYYNYAIQFGTDIKTFYPYLKNDYYQITTESIFDMRLLRSLLTDIIFKHCSFKGFTAAYNYLYAQSQQDRYKLCSNRLTEAFFTYHANKFMLNFPKHPFKSIIIIY